MNRLSLIAALFALTACAGEPAGIVAPAGLSSPDAAARSASDNGIVASVTGHAENTFYQGELLRNVSFSARRHANGRVDGNFQVVLQGPGRFSGYPDEGTQPIHFQVTCLEVEGNKAWIGGRIVAPKNDPYLGGEDVWYVEDGGESGPDRVAVWIGRAAHRCVERGAATGSPSERGELTVRDGL